MQVEDILPPPFEWCEIPAGKVMLEIGGYLEERENFDVPAFAIAKYPVTNAQFGKFIEAGGYREKKWWTEAGWQVKDREKWEEPRYWQDKQWNGAEYPVVGVSWYEAVAFCQWLTDVAGAARTFGSPSRAPLQITLLTEQQWQRAAQGDDGRAYPWGDTFDKERCNTSESRIGQTTPVAKYPQGVSPYGVMDMTGNVLEWCLTVFKTGETDLVSMSERCLRGGSWKHDPMFSHTAYRLYANSPDGWTNLWGFRVCLSPST
jgi:formylglycine-generating enzyme required for sulfatase activity